MVKIISHPKRCSFFELLYRSFLFFITALLQKNRKNMHKGMVFLFNIVATGCHFKDPIAFTIFQLLCLLSYLHYILPNNLCQFIENKNEY